MKILAIDLGKFNYVSCLCDIEANTTEFEPNKTYHMKVEGWLTDKSFSLIPKSLLPFWEKGLQTKIRLESPSPALGEGSSSFVSQSGLRVC